MKLDTYDRGTVEWRAVIVHDNGVPVVAPIRFAVTEDTPADTDWTDDDKRDGLSGVLIDTTTREPGTYTIRARWDDGDEQPQVIAGRIVIA